MFLFRFVQAYEHREANAKSCSSRSLRDRGLSRLFRSRSESTATIVELVHSTLLETPSDRVGKTQGFSFLASKGTVESKYTRSYRRQIFWRTRQGVGFSQGYLLVFRGTSCTTAKKEKARNG